jgi:hypothetical protein
VFSRKKKPYVLDSKALDLETLSILKGALIARRLPLRLVIITCVILARAPDTQLNPYPAAVK